MGLLDNKNRIFNKLAQGMNRKEIFAEFSEQFPSESGKIAFEIGSIPTETLRKKYHYVNLSLFSILIGYALLALTAAMPLEGAMDTFILSLKTCIPFFFSYYVYHFHGGLYKFLGIWCLVEFIQVLFKEENAAVFTYSKVATLCVILSLTVVLCLKVFPHLAFLSCRKDDDGNYLIG